MCARTCNVFPVAPCEGSVLVDLIDVVQNLAAGRRGVEAERRPQVVAVQAPLAQHRRVQPGGREQGGQPVGHVHHLVGHPARVVHPGRPKRRNTAHATLPRRLLHLEINYTLKKRISIFFFN